MEQDHEIIVDFVARLKDRPQKQNLPELLKFALLLFL